MLPIPPSRLDLQAEEPSAFYMARKHLNCLQVGKRSEQIQRLRFGQPANDLHLAQEALAAAIDAEQLRLVPLTDQHRS